ncbi:MAG: hypothetical protein AAFQ44_02040 [Pseudomonadota bacterium]
MFTSGSIVKAATGLTFAGLMALTSAGQAHANGFTSERFGQTQNWTIQRITKSDGAFSHCSATRRQRGPNLMVVARQGQSWGVMFTNKAWRLGPNRETSARLIANGKPVKANYASVGGVSFVFMLGDGRDSVGVIENARWVRFITEKGRKIGYTLKGMTRALNIVDLCVEANLRGQAPGQAPVAEAPQQTETPDPITPQALKGPGKNEIGTATPAQPVAPVQSAPARQATPAAQQAEAPAPLVGGHIAKNGIGAVAAPRQVTPKRAPTVSAPQPASQSSAPSYIVLDREATLEVAARYLSGAQGQYTVRASGEGTFKNFAVNWTLKSGVQGAMKVLAGRELSSKALMRRLVASEKRSCKGTKVIKSKTDAPIADGLEPVEVVTLTCKSAKGKAIFTYQVAQIAPSKVAIILEGIFVPNQKTSGTKGKALSA